MYVPSGSLEIEDQARETREDFSAVTLLLYPDLPRRCLDNLVIYAFSRVGVGWQEHLTLRQRVIRAVAAHARHCHTRYDRIVRLSAAPGGNRQGLFLGSARQQQKTWARKLVEPEVTRLLRKWSTGSERPLGRPCGDQ